MLFDEFSPEDHLSRVFECLRSYTHSLIPNLDVTLHFSDSDDLRIQSKLVEDHPIYPKFFIIISRRLVNLINRCFFCFAKAAPIIMGVKVANPTPIEIYEPYFDFDSLELHLSRLPDDSVIHEDRIEIYLSCLGTAWDWLLLHEFAHITKGHLLFIGRTKELFDSDPSFARAMEHEADEYAANGVMGRKVLNFPSILIGTAESQKVIDYPHDFAALIVSTLYFVIRAQPCTLKNPKGYLPPEIRHVLAVCMLMSQRKWADADASNESFLRALTAATDIARLLTQLPELSTPSIVGEIPLKEYVTQFSIMMEKRRLLQHHWLSLGLGS